MTLEQIAREIEQLESSPLVELCRGEERMKQALQKRLQELRRQERRGLELLNAGLAEPLLQAMMGKEP